MRTIFYYPKSKLKFAIRSSSYQTKTKLREQNRFLQILRKAFLPYYVMWGVIESIFGYLQLHFVNVLYLAVLSRSKNVITLARNNIFSFCKKFLVASILLYSIKNKNKAKVKKVSDSYHSSLSETTKKSISKFRSTVALFNVLFGTKHFNSPFLIRRIEMGRFCIEFLSVIF